MREKIDAAKIMAEHVSGVGDDIWCVDCNTWGPCLPYRLAEALAASEAKVARVKAWRDREIVGGWIESPVEGLDAALSDDPEAFLDALADQPEVSP